MRMTALAALATLALVATGCGDDTKVVTETNSAGQATTRTVADVTFAKTKFVLHGALAYGAFRRYIQKPFQRGAFQKGAPKRKRSMAKAAIATAFVVHELKAMRRAAESDDKLRAIGDKIGAVIPDLDSLADVLRNGGSVAGFGGITSALDAILGDAKAAGAGFSQDKAVKVPGL